MADDKHDPIGVRAPDSPNELQRWLELNPQLSFMLTQTAGVLSSAMTGTPVEIQIQIASSILAQMILRAHCPGCAANLTRQIQHRALHISHEVELLNDQQRESAINAMRAAQSDPHTPPDDPTKLH